MSILKSRTVKVLSIALFYVVVAKFFEHHGLGTVQDYLIISLLCINIGNQLDLERVRRKLE